MQGIAVRFSDDTSPLDPSVFAKVCAEISALRPSGMDAVPIEQASLLIDDIGLDSLKFVDLTVRLESTLRIPEFPMQDWVDGQMARERPLSVGELARACQAMLGASS